MPYTAEEELEFKREFAVRRRRQRLLVIPFVLIVIAITVARNRYGFTAPGALFATAIVALLFSVRNWRCPACKRYLGRGMNPRFCARCGVALSGDAAPRP